MDNNINNFYSLGKAKGLKIVHLNIRSLFKKLDQLRLILMHQPVDILAITETWLNPKIHDNMIKINGYSAHRLDRDVKGSKRGGGLILYIRENKGYTFKEHSQTISSKNHEAQWCTITRTHAKNILLCNIYRPPKGKVAKTIKYLSDSLENLNARSKAEVYIIGDLNIDYKNKRSANYKKLSFFEKSNSLNQVIKNSTRISKTKSSLLDIILTNAKDISQSGTLDTFLSDHQPTYIIKKKQKTHATKTIFSGRSYRYFDSTSFKQNLIRKDWNKFLGTTDANVAWEQMLSHIKEEADSQCPIRNFSISNYRPVWITNELQEQMKDRDYFYNKAK